MKSKVVILFSLTLIGSSFALGQSRRWAVMAAHGPAARSNGAVAMAEERVTDEMTAQLAGLPGVTLIDRASVDKVIKEQDFQNSDRSSAETAARIGKLLGAGQMILLQVYDASFSTHTEQAKFANKATTKGTIVLRANARMIDVETGVIKAQPSSAFQESVTIAEKTTSGAIHFGALNVPAKEQVSGGDPKVIEDNEWAKATESVTKELAAKLTSSIPAAAMAPKIEAELPLVAGIFNGSVFINQGSSSGIKVGDRFQIIREVSIGLNDPKTGKPITQKQPMCILTIMIVDESNSSGKCEGGLPQSKDLAQPIH